MLVLTKCKFYFTNVTVLLSMKQMKNPPEDPHEFMTDFFGKQRSPLWDQMDEWREETEMIAASDIPELTTKLADIEKELAMEKRRTFAYNVFKAADPEATVSSNFI